MKKCWTGFVNWLGDAAFFWLIYLVGLLTMVAALHGYYDKGLRGGQMEILAGLGPAIIIGAAVVHISAIIELYLERRRNRHK